MKLTGGAWSKADLLALVGIIVAVAFGWVAHLDAHVTWTEDVPVQKP
jgi:hypothetical protein